MIMKCHICAHTGEPEWRNEKRYCAVCGSELHEDVPQTFREESTQISDVTCPICRNDENNRPVGGKYRCGLCGTLFDLDEEYYIPYQDPTIPDTSYNHARIQQIQKEKDRNLTLGVIFLFVFWPAAIYFFYKAYKANQELKNPRY